MHFHPSGSLRTGSRLLHVLPFAAALLAGCADKDATAVVAPGSLSVNIIGLPTQAATVRIKGPNGFDSTLTRSATITGLEDGTYQIKADLVEIEGLAWVGEPDLQYVEVKAGPVSAATPITFALTDPVLSLEIEGVPFPMPADISVTGPNGYARHHGLSGVTTMLPGTYTISAAPRTIDGITLHPTPAVQQVELRPGAVTRATVNHVDPGLNLTIEGMYVTQSVQSLDGAVPLVRGRDGMLRVFVVANRRNLSQPSVRIRIYHGATLVHSETTPPRDAFEVTAVDQGSMTTSWNVKIPGALIQPDMSIIADVDPLDRYRESSESDNSFPAHQFDVRSAAPFRVRLVPIKFSANETIADVHDANKETYLAETRAMWPLPAIDADVASLFVTSASPKYPDGAGALLSELQAKRIAEASDRHYYGVISAYAGAGVAGYASVGSTVGVGYDGTRRGEVAAHEWGHNWGRLHAPCGLGMSHLDTNYPYPEGRIGVFGMDVAKGLVMLPSAFDVMSYCTPKWTSDYNYRAVQSYRASVTSASASPQQIASSAETVMLVWGRISSEGAVLEPSFLVTAPAVVPTSRGPFAIEAFDSAGASVFNFSFDGFRVADTSIDERHFAFAIPVSRERAQSIATLRLRVNGMDAAVSTSTALASAPSAQRRSPAETLLRRVSADKVRLRWDAAEYPAALVRDTRTGEVLAIARGGEAIVHTKAAELDVNLSNRITSVARRLKASGQ